MAITASQLDVKLNVQGGNAVRSELTSLGNTVDATARKGNVLAQALATGIGFVGAQVFMRATDAAVDFGREFLNTGMNFEAQMSAVQAVTGATALELESLSDLALQIGKDTQFGATEAAGAIEELAKAGLSVENILGGAADATAALAAAGGVDMPSAASVMSSALNQFQLAGEDSMRVADLLAAASAVSATGVLELGESLKYVGTQANAMGYSIEDITTALAIMADQGIVGSQAGTSLNQALLSLANPTQKARGVMDELGLSFTDLNGNMLPLPDILSQLNTSLEGYGAAQRAAYLETLFGVEGGRAINAMLVTQTEAAQDAGKGWSDYYDAVTESGVASEQAAARMDNTLGALEELKGGIETFAIMLSMLFLPAMRGGIEWASRLVDGLIDMLSAFDLARANGLEPFDAALHALRIGLNAAFGPDVARTVVDTIRNIATALDAARTYAGALLSVFRTDGLSGLLRAVVDDLAGLAIDLGSVAIRIGAWSISALIDLGTAVWDWVTNTAIPAAGDLAADIPSVLVNIASWATGEVASIADWLSAQILGEDFTAPGSTVVTKLMAAMSTAFSVGEAVGGIFDIAGSIVSWVDSQLSGLDFTGVGERIGRALSAALVGILSGGAVFTIVGNAFSRGLSSAIADEIGEDNFVDQVWGAFDTLAEIPAELFAGVAEGFVNGLIDAIAPDGTVDIGPLSIAIEKFDFSAGAKEAFKEAFIAAVIPGGKITLDLLGIDLGEGDAGESGGAFSGIGESLAKGLGMGFSRAWLDFARNILPNLIPGGGGGGYELPAAAPIDFSAVYNSIDDVKARLAEVPAAVQGAFGVAIDTSAFTGGLDTAKAAIVGLATEAQLQVLAMAMAGLQMGQAFGNGVASGINASAGTVLGAVATLSSTAGATGRAGMMVSGLATGIAFGTGTAAGIGAQSGAVGSAVGSLVAVAGGYRGRMMAAGLGIGAALGQGIAAGIRSQVGAIAAEAAGAVTAAIAAAKAAGAISSPSKIMQNEVGRMLGLGVEHGILDSLAGVTHAAEQLVHVPAVPGFAGMGGGTGGGQVVHVNKVEVNVPTTIHIPEHVSDEEVIRILHINAKAQELATKTALHAEGVHVA